MRRAAIGAVLVLAATAWAQEPPRDQVRYQEKVKDPVLTEMEDANEAAAAAAAEETARIVSEQTAREEAEAEARRELRFDVGGVVAPDGPGAFTTVWHQPPTSQFLTGTCWSFSTTSMLESEAKRLGGPEVKLSEMWPVYWEFVEKARGFVRTRGHSLVDHGSESNALLRIVREHGVVPRDQYPGVVAADGRFNHDPMLERITDYLDWCEATGFWDEGVILGTVRSILDREMGAPPETVSWEGRELSPLAFMTEVCRLDPDAYVDVMSTLSKPFWTRAEYEVPDNWWHDASYVNVPLEVFFAAIVDAIDAGYSLTIGGDVSEPGLYGPADVAVVPSFDIPSEYIDQNAREFRFHNGTSTDDHGIHLVGHTRLDGRDWFLIKDSGRSSRRGRFEGYYMFRDDFVKLKMLSFTVHRDAIPEILARVEE